jgi:hypothetical protein
VGDGGEAMQKTKTVFMKEFALFVILSVHGAEVV